MKPSPSTPLLGQLVRRLSASIGSVPSSDDGATVVAGAAEPTRPAVRRGPGRVLAMLLACGLVGFAWPGWAAGPRTGASTATGASAPTQGPTPPAPVAGWVAMTGVSAETVGVLAQPLDGGPALLDWNAGRALNPASTMKLLSTYIALSTLGPDYRWVTSAHLDGPLQAGVLEGNLILRGGGDPKFVIEDLTDFIGRMRAAGLREIRGDLVIDDGLFDLAGDPGRPLDGEASQPYNVAPHPALMNFKSTRVVVRPAGEHVKIMLDPPLADVRIANELRIVGGPCQPGANGLWIRDTSSLPEGSSRAVVPTIRVGGKYSPACGELGVYAAVLSHHEFIHAFFKAAWQAAGGSFKGRTRLQPGAAQGSAWLQWVSPRSLAEIAQDINKFSNNVMTRQVLLSAAAAVAPPASPERARRMVQAWLAERGLVFPELVIDNGSGLSREERISPASLARLLSYASKDAHGDLLRLSMPQVGIDGTMRARLHRHPLVGRAWIKTGSLRDVKSIAGYVDAASGRRYAVVMIINGEPILGAQPAQDAFLRWVYEHG